MRKIVKEVYIGDDGQIYDTEQDAFKADKKFEEEQKNISYWTVLNKPDLTEGRGYYEKINIKAHKQQSHFEDIFLLNEWCFRKLGNPIALVMGASPMKNWILSESNKETWDRNEGGSVGDYKYTGIQISLSFNGTWLE